MPDVPNVPFPARVLLLIVVLAVFAGIDRWRKGAEATRWREYALLLAAAFLGGTFAALNDQLSLWLSPEFFELGKGIERDESFRYNVTEMGFHAGFLAGAIAAGVLLIANNPKPERPGLTLRRLLPSVPIVLVPAVLGGAAGAFLWPGLVQVLAIEALQNLAASLPPGKGEALLRVNGIHGGLYLGALIGLVVSVWRVRRERTRLTPTDA